jgi:PIN domain nuclease of toxin-antitoxin system
MIVLDTHEWIWRVNGDSRLSPAELSVLSAHESSGLGISIISCWEIGLDRALAYPGIRLLDLTPAKVVESTCLPVPFHRDPADQLIVATARIFNVPLLTQDAKLLAYPHVETIALT